MTNGRSPRCAERHPCVPRPGRSDACAAPPGARCLEVSGERYAAEARAHDRRERSASRGRRRRRARARGEGPDEAGANSGNAESENHATQVLLVAGVVALLNEALLADGTVAAGARGFDAPNHLSPPPAHKSRAKRPPPDPRPHALTRP